MEVITKLVLGDCREEMKHLKGNSIDLIFTSPPYCDSRKKTYGGIHPDKNMSTVLCRDHALSLFKKIGIKIFPGE